MCRAGMRTLMATGDYHYTALAVARGVGMVPPHSQVIIIQTGPETQPSSFPAEHLRAEAPATHQSPHWTPEPVPTRQPTLLKTGHRTPQLAGFGSQLNAQHMRSATKRAGCSGEDCPRPTPVPNLPLGHLSESMSCSSQQHAVSSHQGLVFDVDSGLAAHYNAQQALTAIAQVGVSCSCIRHHASHAVAMHSRLYLKSQL